MADAVHDILGVRAGMAVTRPRRFPLEGAMSDAGWYLIVVDGCSHRFLQPPVLNKLSGHAEVVTCVVRPDEPCPAFDGRFVLLESTSPTLKQRLFGG
jgi:hypothetical protein